MQNNERSANGLLIAGALVLAGIYVLTGKHNHFTVAFTQDMLPKLLQDKMPDDAEAIMITVTLVSKECASAAYINSDKENAGIIYNKMINFFGRHDTGEMKERRES